MFTKVVKEIIITKYMNNSFEQKIEQKFGTKVFTKSVEQKLWIKVVEKKLPTNIVHKRGC